MDSVRPFALRVPFATLLKIALFALLVYVTIKLLPVLILLVVAVLIAIVLAPIRDGLQQRGARPGLAVALIGAVVVGIVLTVLLFIVPQTAREMGDFRRDLPKLRQKISHALPGATPYFDALTARVTASAQTTPKSEQSLQQGMRVARRVLSVLTAVFFVVAVSLYLLVDGKRLLAWLVSYAPQRLRARINETLDEVQPIMLAYIRGQLITSTLSMIVALSVLLPFRVPAAIPLAVLAFIGDFIPIVGFIAATVPAVALALTVSPTAALSVLAVYMLYQALENYVIIPRVYGKQLEMSNLTVLLAFTAGGVLGGPLGAILILPFVSAYPVVERIWLSDWLAADTVAKHEAIGGDDKKKSERAAKAVLGE